jgi:hypothetical protein
LGLFKINFDGRLVQGFSNPKSQSWKNRLVNGSFPSHWSQQQNATINHSIHDYIIGLKQVLLNMSSSDSNCLFAAAPRRVVEDTVIIVDKKTFSCEAEKVLVENCTRLLALYTLCIGLETVTDNGATKHLLDFD